MKIKGKEFYESRFDPGLVDTFWQLTRWIEEHAQRSGWEVEREENNKYVSFRALTAKGKRGWVAFGVGFHTSVVMGPYIKSSRLKAEHRREPGLTFFRFRENDRQVEYQWPGGAIDLTQNHNMLSRAFVRASNQEEID